MEQKKVLEEDLISVVMPAYNAEKFIDEAVNSVINQSYTNFELLIIDDCSNDSTYAKAKAFADKDQRIRVFRNDENMGVAKTRNKGLDLCLGKYAALLDSDDYWTPDFLTKMVELENRTNADFIYCSYGIVNEQGKKICKDFIVPEKTSFEDSMIRNVLSCSTVLFNEKTLKTARFPTDVYHEDIALWFKTLKNGGTACGVTDVMAFYRQSDNTRSGNKLKSAFRRWPIYRKYLGLPFFKSVMLMAKYAYYGFKKYRKHDIYEEGKA